MIILLIIILKRKKKERKENTKILKIDFTFSIQYSLENKIQCIIQNFIKIKINFDNTMIEFMRHIQKLSRLLYNCQQK